MNKSLPVAVSFALILTACAHMGNEPAFRDFGARAASVAYASVQVVGDNTIVVSQEPIYVKQETAESDKVNRIFWSLPPGETYYFSNTGENPGIKFPDWKPHPDCDLYNKDKYTYSCSYKKSDGKKRYEIRVTNGARIVVSDPTVMNN